MDPLTSIAFWLRHNWPFIPAMICSAIEFAALRGGSAWAFGAGIPLRHKRESLPLAIPDTIPDIREDEVRVVRIEPWRFGFFARGEGPSADGSVWANGPGSYARVSGLLAHGEVRVHRNAEGTEFEYRGRVALFPVFGILALIGTMLIDSPSTIPWSAVLEATAFPVVFFAFFVFRALRHLDTTYEVLSACLASRGKKIEPVPRVQAAAS